MAATSQQRIPYWDNLKGILIILVVCGHYLWEYRTAPGIAQGVYALYVFHMPAFIFVSGYFSRGKSSTRSEALVKIFVLYILLNFSMMFYAKFVEAKSLSLITPYYSSWYLLALFLYRLTLPICRRVPLVIPLSVLVSIGIGFFWRIDTVFELQKIVALYPFFIAGAQLTSGRMDDFVARLGKHRATAWAVLVVLLLLALWLAERQIVGQKEAMWLSYDHNAAPLIRLLMLALAGAILVALLAVTPRREIPLITTWGRNSLVIYLLHRIFTLLLVLFFPRLGDSLLVWFWLPAASLITLWILGGDALSRPINRGLDRLAQTLVGGFANHRIGIVATGFVFVVGLAAGAIVARGGPRPLIEYARSVIAPAGQNAPAEIIHPVISAQQEAIIDNAVSLSFVGDLILLRDQVFKARDRVRGQYDYDGMFQYSKPYLSRADLSLGVFEGPLAGEGVEYSTSRYDDGIPLLLNFPDSFARSVKAAGIDFVTLATNHLLDRGSAGAIRTLDELDRLGLAHAGSYRSEQDKAAHDIPIIVVKGLRVAILTYTYGSNYYPSDYFFDPRNAFHTSVIVDPKSEYFQKSKNAVLDDFKRAKAKMPDTIVVMPHMGKQFMHAPDAFQKAWVDIFVGAGADVVLSDHPHAVQPVEWRKTQRHDRPYALVVNCPGNFVNSYTDLDGDAMAIVEAYLDPKNGVPVAAAIVPMWAQSMMRGSHRALPVYSIMHDAQLQKEISTHDLARVQQVHALTTRIMLGHELSLDQAQRRYFLFPEGYVRSRVEPIEVSDSQRTTRIYTLLSNAKSVCFIGDSVTEGTRNGGYGWYEPLVAAFPDLAVERRAWGSHTIKMLLARKNDILDCHADVYVIAIGTNDVRYRSERNSSMTAADYVNNVDTLLKEISSRNAQARFALVGAWTTDHYDPVSALGERERMAMLKEYREALRAYAADRDILCIDPNPGIESVLRTEYAPDYLKDHIHPNADQGIRLYSRKVLEASP